MRYSLLSASAIIMLSAICPNRNLIAQCFLDNGQLTNLDGTPCVNTVVTGVPFLNIVADARSGAMGDAGIATSTDPNGIHHNAAKLAFTETNLSVSANYTPWLRTIGLSDVYIANIAALKQINETSAVGIEMKYFSQGQIQFSDQDGQTGDNGNPNEYVISGAYATQIRANLSASITGKYIYSNLAAGQTVAGEDITAGTSMAADFGLLYKIPNSGSNRLSIGLVLSNIGSKIAYTNVNKKDFLPSRLGLGFGYEINPKTNRRITFALDIKKIMVPPRSAFNEDLMYSIGAEYWLGGHVAIRGGYFSEDELSGQRKYLTTGFGLKYDMIGFNVSYLKSTSGLHAPIDNTLRFSLLYDFDY